MKTVPPALRIVVIDHPYDAWANHRTPPLFAQVVALKRAGFGREYPKGVLPVDGSDFVAHHQLICFESSEGLRPVSAYRSITLERCREHALAFPALTLARMSGSPEHERAVARVLDRCERTRTPISYGGSWTVDPSIRADRALAVRLRHAFSAMYLGFHRDYGIRELLAGGTLRFNTQRMLARWGHRPLQAEGGAELGPIPAFHLRGEPVLLMHLERFASELEEEARPWMRLWEERLVISAEGEQDLLSSPLKKAA